MGLLHAALGLVARAAQGVLHLRAVNPYLEPALAGAPMTADGVGGGGGWSLPRAGAGLPQAEGECLHLQDL